MSRSAILDHVLNPERGDLAQELAQFILTLDFPPADHERYAELAAKAQEGSLSGEERALLDDYLFVNDFLTIVQAKAGASMNRPGNSAA